MTTTTYAAIDLLTDDEIDREALKRAIVDLSEGLVSGPLFKGQADEIRAERDDLQALLDTLDATNPRWFWLQRIDAMEEPPENPRTFVHCDVTWEVS